MDKISYKSLWEASYKWLTSVKNDVYLSYCKICKKTFRNDGSKWSQVQVHARGNKHLALDPEMKDKSQRTLVMVVGNEVELSKNDTVLKPEDQITKTEILNTLHDVHNNYSFRSTEDDSKIYAALFPDSERAKNYQNGETKTKYFVQFGIVPYIKEMLIFLILIKPFFFLFDETINSQVQKQYDMYIRYWSKCQKEVVTAYCGSLFIGHCDSKQLVEHYYEFEHNTKLNSKYLLHLGMDGPNVNKKFECELATALNEHSNTAFLKLKSCSLHKVHTAYRKGIKELKFDLDQFFYDVHYFFKLSSA